MRVKYLILGAGPAGLSVANKLKQLGEESFLVLEKEREAGGLCRSKEVDDCPLDIGGGHFLDTRNEVVNEFLFGFMPKEEWNLYERDSRIKLGDVYLGHPFEANIWQLGQEKQIEYLKSIAIAGCNLNQEMPEKFVDWIKWKLGECIARDYMIPYNQKMFGNDLNQLGTYWLEKLPNVSFEETLLSCLNKKPYGTQPGHAKFYYPKEYGYGELWRRMADALGDKILFQKTVSDIDYEKTIVSCEDGTSFVAENIITTIPWTCIKSFVGMPVELQEKIQQLKHTSVNITYYPEKLNTEAHWIYYPDRDLEYHRILVRSNFVPDGKGYWTETNTERFTESDKETFLNEYAYPLNTIDKPLIMKELLGWSKEKNVIGLGRWGEWQHYNSDVTVNLALKLAKDLTEKA